jgi:hypothetical protein
MRIKLDDGGTWAVEKSKSFIQSKDELCSPLSLFSKPEFKVYTPFLHVLVGSFKQQPGDRHTWEEPLEVLGCWKLRVPPRLLLMLPSPEQRIDGSLRFRV